MGTIILGMVFSITIGAIGTKLKVTDSGGIKRAQNKRTGDTLQAIALFPLFIAILIATFS